MQRAIRSMAQVAKRQASQVPLPARAKTSGTVMVGEVVGAMVEMDWARVSMGERMFGRRPVGLEAGASDAVMRACSMMRVPPALRYAVMKNGDSAETAGL